MIFTTTKLSGAFVIEPERFKDKRGFFAPAWTQAAFAAHGIEVPAVECNISYSAQRGTLRGIHYQRPPHAQAKLVRCTAGAIFDVIVDLRPDAPTFKQWYGVELSADSRRLLYVPSWCAHGFQTLVAKTEIVYQVSDVYAPQLAAGVRWNDPAFGIEWPVPKPILLLRDAQYPDFTV
jgi:dTDP-4-dehydrorhamnose 3,5-epimerase